MHDSKNIKGRRNIEAAHESHVSRGRERLSRTRKLLTQINEVCQAIRDIKVYSSTKKNHSPLDIDHKNREPLPDKYEKGGKGCTRSTGNRKHARCEDLHNSPNTQTRHEAPFPPSTLPPSSPSPTSSHSSSEAFTSELSTSSDGPPSCSTGGVGLLVVLD